MTSSALKAIDVYQALCGQATASKVETDTEWEKLFYGEDEVREKRFQWLAHNEKHILSLIDERTPRQSLLLSVQQKIAHRLRSHVDRRAAW